MRRTRIFDRLYRLIGYIPVDSVPEVRVEQVYGMPTFVDIRMPHGTRVAGHLWSPIHHRASEESHEIQLTPEQLEELRALAPMQLSGPKWREICESDDIPLDERIRNG